MLTNNDYYSDIFWMRHAIYLAKNAKKNGEVPVGAVLTLNKKIIGEGWNSSIINNDPSSHAEIIALHHGGKFTKNYRLLNSILYVTLEPCIMCAGALINARISRLVFGTKSKKTGSAGSSINILNDPIINHNILITSNVLEKECSTLLSDFFKSLRNY